MPLELRLSWIWIALASAAVSSVVSMFDGTFRALDRLEAPIPDRTRVLVHVGTAQIEGTLAWVTCGNAGIRVYDVSNPSAPVDLAQITAAQGRSLQAVGDYVYFADSGSSSGVDLGVIVVAIAGLGSLSGHHFDLVAMTAQENLIPSEGLRHFVWILLLIGFATKMPSVPVHTWLPDAHVQAPTAGSMLLAGVMLKMGAYGFLRISVTVFPESTLVFVPLLIVLGMVSLVYGAWVCMGQTNLKRMVAYSSVSHMGLIFLGIATMQPLGIAGALFMMFAHGIISPLLFAVAGAFKHHYHTLEIGSMRGIAHHSPWLAAHMMLGWMASLGLPLLAGFVAEITILIAFWMTYGWLVLLPALTLIITAVYYLNSMQRTIFESNDPEKGILPESLHGEEPSDLSWHENAGMLTLAALTALFGIMPFIFWDMMSDWSSGFVVDTMIEAMQAQEWFP